MPTPNPDEEAQRRPAVLFYCRFPPPYTGMTICTARVFDTLAEHLPVIRIDISDGAMRPRGFLTWLRRGASTVRAFARLVRGLFRNPRSTLYTTCPSSPAGLLRDILVLLLVRPLANRIVLHVHSGAFAGLLARMGSIGSLYVKKADRVIFLAEDLARDAGGYVPAAKVAVVPNTVDIPLRRTDQTVEQSRQRRMDARVLQVLFNSNLLVEKGFLDALNAAVLLAGQPVHFVFLGEWVSARNRMMARAIVANKGLAAQVTFTGPIRDRSRMARFYEEADVVLIPTYYRVEAQPLTMIEALQFGLPVVATRHATIGDTIRDGENGLLIEAHSPQAIAGALLSLKDRTALLRMSLNARQTYVRDFGPGNVERLLLEVFESD